MPEVARGARGEREILKGSRGIVPVVKTGTWNGDVGQ